MVSGIKSVVHHIEHRLNFGLVVIVVDVNELEVCYQIMD